MKISIGPPIEDGFYYDFDFPDGTKLTEEDFERVEAKMREHIKADETLRAQRAAAVRGDRALPGGGTGLQGRADRGPRRGGRSGAPARDGLALPQRPLHGPLPRAARAGHQADQGLQAHERGGRLLARGRQPPDAHARLRDRLPDQGGSSRSTCTGSRRRAPATTASWAASSGCSCSPTSRRARRSGCPTARTSGTS